MMMAPCGVGISNRAAAGRAVRIEKSKRIDRAEALGHPHFSQHHLTPHFQHAIAVIRRCLQIRNQYAHWALWDDNSGKLAFANLESLAKLRRAVNDLRKLRTFHVNAALLAEQEAYYIYFDRYSESPFQISPSKSSFTSATSGL
jgi:hypothetical protein